MTRATFVLVLALVVGVTGCSSDGASRAAPEDAPDRAPAEEPVRVQQAPFRSVVVVEAEVRRADPVVVPTGDGFVATVQSGTRVEPGQAVGVIAPGGGSTLDLERAVDDATRAYERIRAQRGADPLAATADAEVDARIARDRAAEDLARAREGRQPRTITAPVAGTATVLADGVRIQPSGWDAVAAATPLERFRIGPKPLSATFQLELPTGRTALDCAAVRDAPPPDATDETGAQGVACQLSTDEYLVAGLPGLLRVVAVELPDALAVPASAVELDRGSVSKGSVVVRRGGRRIEEQVTIQGFNGLLVAVDGEVTASDTVVDPHPG